MIAAAMLAMPLIQKMEQGLMTRISNGVSAFFASPTDSASGQNVPATPNSTPANSAQSSSASTAGASSTTSLSASITSALLAMQSDTIHGHHHHHGTSSYKAASSLATSTTTASAGSTTAPVTA